MVNTPRIMKKTELTKEVCPFCGKRKIVTITTKDFWEEHRGNSWTEEEREEEEDWRSEFQY